jgi:hypothetical protein
MVKTAIWVKGKAGGNRLKIEWMEKPDKKLRVQCFLGKEILEWRGLGDIR